MNLRRLVFMACAPLALGCPSTDPDDTSTTTTTTATTTEPTPTTSSTGADPGPPSCPDGALLDVLFVVDNSYDMLEAQIDLSASTPHLLARLRGLTDAVGAPIDLDVNVMFTTTDMGHPVCSVYQPKHYYPARGEPTASPCTARMELFHDPAGQEFCADVCPDLPAAAPADPFIHFAGDQHNIVDANPAGDPVARALACVGPQGFAGCNYESPLEAMLQALADDKPWNNGDRPFLRDCAALAIVVVSNETDCSVAEDGYRYFDNQYKNDPDYNIYMENDPYTPADGDVWVTSAVCWNASMACEPGDVPGTYTSCTPVDRGVLHPVARYTGFLREKLSATAPRPVFMLAITGVPPTPGGIDDLEYHDFTEADLVPGDPYTVEQLQSGFGIGPGCSAPGIDHAIPPGRIQAVCQALDVADDPSTPGDDAQQRCCIASVCAGNNDGAFDCLADQLAQQLRPAP